MQLVLGFHTNNNPTNHVGHHHRNSLEQNSDLMVNYGFEPAPARQKHFDPDFKCRLFWVKIWIKRACRERAISISYIDYYDGFETAPARQKHFDLDFNFF